MFLPEDNYSVVCFGEILWDVLPGSRVPGGAPMNVAYHLVKLGLRPALITRIGWDSAGKELFTIAAENNISTDFFQFDNTLATGKAFAVAWENNDMMYDIVQPVAWDNIKWEDIYEKLLSNAPYFVFGSLAARERQSRNTLYKLLEMARFKVLDINLRTPHYHRRVIENLLNDVYLLKLNLAELELISGWFCDHKTDMDRISTLQEKFLIPNIFVTKGANGSILNAEGHFYEHPGYKVRVADTVGSGDASLAGLLAKLLQGCQPSGALAFSGALGTLIATYDGACPDYKTEEVENLMNAGRIKTHH